MGARRRKVNQQASAGLDTTADYLDIGKIKEQPATSDATWYSAVGFIALAVLAIWSLLYVFHKSLKGSTK